MAESRRSPPKQTKKDKPPMIATSTSPATPAVHDLIGLKLRSYFDEVTKEPVPDRFAALLSELEAKTTPEKSG